MLKALCASRSDIDSAFLFNIDGLIIVSNIEQDTTIDEIGAAAAAIKNIASRSNEILQRGKVQQVYILSEKGSMIITGINEELILVVLAEKQPNIGLIMHEINAVVQNISKQVSV